MEPMSWMSCTYSLIHDWHFFCSQTARLSTASQSKFGTCCLSLSPIDGDAVATPSGHVYSREAIVEYLLTKNGELKKEKSEYERKRLVIENRRVEMEEQNRKIAEQKFVKKDQGAMSSAIVLRKEDGDKKRPAVASSTSDQSRSTNSLNQVSYWLATAQPQHTKGMAKDGEFDYVKEIEALGEAPPDRPPSPMSKNPLKLKSLIPIHLVHEGDEDGKAKKGDATGKILCGVSHKAITTQPAVLIKNSGQIMLKSVYEELAKPDMVCPVTSKKFKEKDVIELVKGRSGFAASGETVAKKYNPTMT